MQVVVLAGGLATRMRPHTERVPKSLLEVAGRPFVDWQLELLAACGAREIVMCIAHLGEQIRAHVGGIAHGMRVTYATEPTFTSASLRDAAPPGQAGPCGRLLGTAGALRAALPLLAPAFVVTYGDSYLPFDYAAPLAALGAHADCDGVMAVFHNAGKYDASNVVTDGTWVLRYEKGARDPAFDHVDYGAMALRREVIAALPAGEPRGLDAVQHDLAEKRRLRALVARERFFEIGSPQGLAELDHHLRKRAAP